MAAARKLGWDVVLKATADHLRERPDLAHVWRNIDTPAEMRDAWESLNSLITDAEQRRVRGAEELPAGRPRRPRAASRTRCSARSCRSASPGR